MTLHPFPKLGMMAYWPVTPVADAVARARAAEAAGFDCLWCGDASSDPFSVIAMYSRATTSIGLGTGIVSWARTPVAMAIAATTVDEISGGRFRLGLGTMPKDWNERWHGIDASRPVGRMNEYIEVIRQLWQAHSGKKLEFEGTFFRITDYTRWTKPVRDRVPVYLAVAMPQMTRLAGRIADGVFFHQVHSLQSLREISLPSLAAGAASAGRSLSEIDTSPSIVCSISKDRREAIEFAKPFFVGYTLIPYTHPAFDLHGFRSVREQVAERVLAGDHAGAVAAIPDELPPIFGLVGTPDDCRKKLAEYQGLVTTPSLATIMHGVPADYAAENFRLVLDTFGVK